MERKRVKSKPHECMAFREIASSFPARRVSSTFVSFQWGNGSHCQECQNKPTIPRRSYGTLCQIDSSDKQPRTSRDRETHFLSFPVYAAHGQPSIIHPSPSTLEIRALKNTQQLHFSANKTRQRRVPISVLIRERRRSKHPTYFPTPRNSGS
jgi:hypothetical protein